MCGILGISNRINEAFGVIYDGLLMLQHRGQDAAGMMTENDGKYHLRKSNGLVKDVFFKRHMQNLLGAIGIGHVRYPTAGSSSAAEAQPFYVNYPFGISLAHNGNLTNADEIRSLLTSEHRRHVNTTSDSELLLNLLAMELHSRTPNLQIDGELHVDVNSIFSSVSALHKQIRGGYACVSLISGYGILAFRDPNGIRPLIFGKREIEGETEWMIASESVALHALGFEVIRDVEPGEAVFITSNGQLFTKQCAEETLHSPCIFEHVYFSRPDSIIDGISVYQARLKQGQRLAERIMEQFPDHDIDAVIPVPDSGRYAALQMANALDVEYREGFVKNRYIGRTFIMPGQALRKKSVRRKLNAIPHEFEGKNVLLVDDSIVRGTTSAQIVEMAREVGANKVYFASAAPPVRHPNVYGIDMPAVTEFIADGKTVDEIGDTIGADRLFYQTLEDLIEVTSINGEQSWDTSCFNGEYVTGDVTQEYLDALEAARNDSAKETNKEPEGTIELHNDE